MQQRNAAYSVNTTEVSTQLKCPHNGKAPGRYGSSELPTCGLFQKAGLVKTLSKLTQSLGKLWFFGFTKPVQLDSESVTLATYSVNLTCWLAGFLQLTSSFLAEACRLKELSDMVCPFLKESVNIETQIRSINLRQRVISPRWDVLLFSDDVLFECFHFNVQSIIYLNNILSPRIVCTTPHGHALSSE